MGTRDPGASFDTLNVVIRRQGRCELTLSFRIPPNRRTLVTASYYGLAEAQPPLGQTLGVLLGEVRLPTARGPGGPPKLDNLTSPSAASEMCVGGTACENSMGSGSGSVQGAASAVDRLPCDLDPIGCLAQRGHENSAETGIY